MRVATAPKHEKLYSLILKVVDESPAPLLIADIKKRPEIKKEMSRPSLANEAVLHLASQKKLQRGYGKDGEIIVAGLGKPFPASKTPPPTSKWANRKPRGTGKAALKRKAKEAEALALQQKQEQAQQTPPPPPPQEDIAAPHISHFQAAFAPNIDSMVNQFANSIAEVIAARIVSALNLQLPTHIDALVDQYKNGSGPKKEALPKVIIAGLLPAQAGLMVAEFGKELDFAFIEQTEASNSKRIDQLLESHPMVYAMVSFMNHSLDGKLNKGARVYQRISGGLTSLRNALREYIEATKKSSTSSMH
jgi:hypothetical protein